jgi:hypothetical protein
VPLRQLGLYLISHTMRYSDSQTAGKSFEMFLVSLPHCKPVYRNYQNPPVICTLVFAFKSGRPLRISHSILSDIPTARQQENLLRCFLCRSHTVNPSSDNKTPSSKIVHQLLAVIDIPYYQIFRQLDTRKIF